MERFLGGFGGDGEGVRGGRRECREASGGGGAIGGGSRGGGGCHGGLGEVDYE